MNVVSISYRHFRRIDGKGSLFSYYQSGQVETGIQVFPRKIKNDVALNLQCFLHAPSATSKNSKSLCTCCKRISLPISIGCYTKGSMRVAIIFKMYNTCTKHNLLECYLDLHKMSSEIYNWSSSGSSNVPLYIR